MLSFYMSMLDTEEEKIAVADLYEQMKRICLHVAMQVTHDKALAEDAVHEAFISVIKQKDTILSQPRGKQRSKIVNITKNRAIDLMRRRNRHPEDSIDEPNDGKVIADRFDVSEFVVGQVSAERLVNMIRTLPEIYKTVFELRYVHEMKNSEIAKLLDISSKAVHMRIVRAKIMLQEIIDKEKTSNV